MINFEDVKRENMINEHNPSGMQIPNHPYRLLFNPISHQTDVDKIYLYTIDPNEAFE